MTDLPSPIEVEVAKAVIQVLLSGAQELIKKIPALFRRAGKAKEEQRAAEVEQAKAVLAAAGDDVSGQVRLRQETQWEVRINDLLAEYPDARAELEEFLAHLRRQLGSVPEITQQNIHASAPGAFASGAIDGNVIHYHSRVPTPSPPSATGDEGEQV